MSPSDIAQQQVLAAWVSAGAAVAQALGAVAAIVASVVLARGSALREADAEAAAVERERQADANAERRAREAEDNATAREERAERLMAERRAAESADALEAYRGRALHLGTHAIQKLEAIRESWLARASSGDRSTYMGGALATDEYVVASQSLNDLRDEGTPDPELAVAVAALAHAAAVERLPQAAGSPAAIAAAVGTVIARLRGSLDPLQDATSKGL